MAGFHDLNINEQNYVLRNTYRYTRSGLPFTYTYLRKYEKECSDDVRLCDFETYDYLSLKVQFKFNYDILAFNDSIISLVTTGGSGCGMYLKIFGINASATITTCDEFLNVDIYTIYELLASYTNCDLCGLSGLMNFSGDVFEKKYSKMKQDSGKYIYTKTKVANLQLDETQEYNGEYFIDSFNASANISRANQVTLNFNVHYSKFETIYNENDINENITVPIC